LEEDSLAVRFILCADCVEKNMEISDILDYKDGYFAKAKPTKEYAKKENSAKDLKKRKRVEIEDGDAEDGESNAETNSEMEDE
jgi:predicted adenine nucleotide alpha hydrolase (AANH) superfamily ATPase